MKQNLMKIILDKWPSRVPVYYERPDVSISHSNDYNNATLLGTHKPVGIRPVIFFYQCF
ncbi:hypothetical protein Scep_009613 [Stephania cephalantha]|uniref:Uncharacterized protein n=1 Tax=Stephania cephalantha TaxID=152367 RepID=A0AAP0JTL0_9MAGN